MKIRIAAALCLAAVTVALSCIAAGAYGESGYENGSRVSAGGVRYEYTAQLSGNSGGALAAVRTRRTDGKLIEPGCAGAQVFLFRSDGALVGNSPMIYKSEAADEITAEFETDIHGEYLARGYTAYFTSGSGFKPQYSAHLTSMIGSSGENAATADKP